MECLDSVKNASFFSFLKQGLFFRKDLEKKQIQILFKKW
jgi:hypothetical protein